jgi:SecD/SecF fusion protein
LSFTFVSQGLDKEANTFAMGKDGKIDLRKKQAYEDSLWNKPVYLGETYQGVKEKEINLGLDLQGGMHVVMEVSPVEILKALSNNNQDPKFLQAIKEAKEAQKNSQKNFLDLFYKSFQKTAPGVKLSSIFANSGNKDKISFTSTDAEVLSMINKEVEGAIERSLEIVRTRIDQFGVVQPNVQRLGNTGRIQVELPGVDNPERVRKLLAGVAKLEFWEVYLPQDYFSYLGQLDKYITAKEKSEKKTDLNLNAQTDSAGTKKEDETGLTGLSADTASTSNDTAKGVKSKTDSAVKAKADSIKKSQEGSGLTKYFQAQYLSAGMLVAKVKDTARINALLEDPAVKVMFPSSMKFMWEKPFRKTDENTNSREQNITLYVIKNSIDGKAPLEGDVIKDARQDIGDIKKDVEVVMTMTPAGAAKWKKLTAAVAAKGNPQYKIFYQIAIVLDNHVYSAPTVQNEIPNGISSISGSFTIEEAKDLANVLKAGKLPAPMQIVEETVVGPSLGQEAINQGLITILAGFIAIIIFMVLYYNTGGLIADIAVLFNLFLMVAILADWGAVLTLPGIAGIVLTVGMAVDANVLINERIKEELRAGRPLDLAIRNGFSAAQVTILDANITVAMAGFVLLFFGSGPVQGFATTLLLGIGTSLFSSILVTRLISEFAIDRKLNLKFTWNWNKNLFVDFYYNFIAKRKIAYIASSVFIGIGLISMFVRGFDYGVDFKGGWSYIVKFEKPVTSPDIRKALATPLTEEPEVKSFGSEDKMKITTTYLIDKDGEGVATQVQEKLAEGLNTLNTKYEVIGVSKVGPTIADDIRGKAIGSVALSLVLMFAYIFIRFRRWEYAAGATIALFHDALVVVAVFTLFKGILPFALEIDQNFIAAILTIVGYSVNDTVVIFDRIRENIQKGDGTENVEKVVNKALTDTFSRSLVTAFTVFLVVLLIFIFGGQVLRGMSLALLIGVISGSYSTLFIAVPFLVDVVKQDLITKTEPVATSTVQKGKPSASRR